MIKHKLLLVDGNSILNRAFYGLLSQKMMSTSDGIYTNAVFGFVNILLKFLDEEKPQYIAVAFDLKAPTFRHTQYEGYKAQRKGMPEELQVQVPLIKEVLDAMNIKRIEKEGYEADDIIGSLSEMAAACGAYTVILTGDRDSLQLVNDNVKVRLPVTRAGKTETEDYDTDGVILKYGIKPSQMIELKALMGDSSDNIPGVKGIGEKTAQQLISDFGTLENLYANLENVKKESIRTKLENDREMAFLSRKLATIEKNTPDMCILEQLEFKHFNKHELYKLFKRLEFKYFIQRLGLSDTAGATADYTPIAEAPSAKTSSAEASSAEAPSAETPSAETYAAEASSAEAPSAEAPSAETYAAEAPASSAPFNTYIPYTQFTLLKPDFPTIIPVDNVDKLIKLKSSVTDKKYFYLSYSFISKHNESKPKKQFDISKNSLDKIYISLGDGFIHVISGALLKNNDAKDILKSIFENSMIKIYGHDLKTLSVYLLWNNISLAGEAFDTMLAGYVEDPQDNSFDIDRLAGRYLDTEEFNHYNNLNFDSIFNKYNFLEIFNPVYDINALKTVYLLQILVPAMNKKLESNNTGHLFYKIELPLSGVLAQMEYIGFRVNPYELASLGKKLDLGLKQTEEEIFEQTNERFNINSPKQLGVVLFDKIGLSTSKKNKSGYSTDIDVLESLYDKHAVIPKVIYYRQLAKLKSTYIEGLLSEIKPETGRIHSSFRQTVTATGRISSTEPNLQNIPIRLDLGREIRKAFIPANNMVLIDADYSQIELRILAHIAQDEEMIRAFSTGLDIHTATACGIYDVDAGAVTSAMRSRAKTINFSIIYGISGFSLSRDLGITRKEADRYIKAYFEKYRGVDKYMKQIVEEAKEKGYVETMFKRRRYLPELKSSNHNTRLFGERIAMNMPVQGTAADIIKIAMVKIAGKLKELKSGSRLILQVHDELILEAPEDEAETAAGILKECMEGAVSLSVPLIVETKTGKSWYETKQ